MVNITPEMHVTLKADSNKPNSERSRAEVSKLDDNSWRVINYHKAKILSDDILSYAELNEKYNFPRFSIYGLNGQHIMIRHENNCDYLTCYCEGWQYPSRDWAFTDKDANPPQA